MRLPGLSVKRNVAPLSTLPSTEEAAPGDVIQAADERGARGYAHGCFLGAGSFWSGHGLRGTHGRHWRQFRDTGQPCTRPVGSSGAGCFLLSSFI